MCLERTKKRSSYWSYVKEDSLIAEGFITTPLSQKKLQKNITQKSHAPRITWKGKGTRRKMREVGAWKNNSVRPVDALAVKKVNHSVTDNLKSRDSAPGYSTRFPITHGTYRACHKKMFLDV